MTLLAEAMRPCGPIRDNRAAERLLAILTPELDPDLLGKSWPALAPIFGASPYLASLVRSNPQRLAALLASDPEDHFAQILKRTRELADGDLETARAGLRRLKAETHLLIALADLGGVWDLDQVTGALTHFADAALQTALAVAAKAEFAAGRLAQVGGGAHGPIPGYFAIAMGKHGAFELNYSSDIDISIFYEPAVLAPGAGTACEALAMRITHHVAGLMQDRTPDGYVFRVDLRLRPDPSSTPLAVSVPAAMEYYGSVGQNWERAAFIKARVCVGDFQRGQALLDELSAFVWRKNLDFAAIADIHAIKRQIHVHKVDDRLTAKGVDVKLGRGGIREIEFYVQTQQLILGGRHLQLRSPRTLDAMAALASAGHISASAADEMCQAYGQLRAIEHRIQMLADEQTHRLPESDADRGRVAALSGYERLRSFDAAVERTLRTVNRRYGELFSGEEALSSRFGSLVFTGVDDDPETLTTLARMGLTRPQAVSQAIRSWHHGHIAATRTERGRELFTQLAPRLLDAVQATGVPDMAFMRFADFFGRLSSGVQLQSLFLAQPILFELIVRVMAYAPRLANTLARRPAALDAMLDGDFFSPVEVGESRRAMQHALGGANGFEATMDVVRRIHREQSFRVGVQVMSGTADAALAGRAFADLADICIESLAPAALAEVVRVGGAFEGDLAVVALGKCGSREMSAGSDLDLMTLYRAERAEQVSTLKGWSADVFFGRVTQRLIAALSTPTAEGELYEVDMQLRPSGTKGPVAVSMTAFEDYYEREAETWEMMALTRARVVWSTSPGFAEVATKAIETALRRPRDRAQTGSAVRDMRDLMNQERPPSGPWDMKLSPGGLVDVEFAVQFLQLVQAPQGGPLHANTALALQALGEGQFLDPGRLTALQEAWRLQQDLTQLLKLALTEADDPADQPKPFRQMLAKAGGVRDFKALKGRLDRCRANAHAAFEAIAAR